MQWWGHLGSHHQGTLAMHSRAITRLQEEEQYQLANTLVMAYIPSLCR